LKSSLRKENVLNDRNLRIEKDSLGDDKASKIAHYAMDNDLTLKDAALKLGWVRD
jgi:fumarate hydratase, class II